MHQPNLASDFRNDIVSAHTQNPRATSSVVTCDLNEELPGNSTDTQDEELRDSFEPKNQLKLNLASLFLKMQAILHVSNMATQEIVDNLNHIFSLSQPLIKGAVSVSDILRQATTFKYMRGRILET